MNYMLGQRSPSPGTHVIQVGGEVDMGAAPELREAVGSAIEDGVSLLVIDLSDASFIDSTAIGIIVSARSQMKERGGALELVCTEPNLMRIFQVVGIDRELSIHSTCDEALRTLAGAR
jgi:anti-sigma B factor antagonist